MDKRTIVGSVPWTGALNDRVHPMYVQDNDMTESYDVDLRFDGSKVKRADVRDMYGIIYLAVSEATANNPG